MQIGFNSQPPEDGWAIFFCERYVFCEEFQLTAARRRLAGGQDRVGDRRVGFNSQPPEDGWCPPAGRHRAAHCFNSQPPEDGWPLRRRPASWPWPFQLTAARRRLDLFERLRQTVRRFQLTAARRRLVTLYRAVKHHPEVSTHSRPKTAGPGCRCLAQITQCFNSQPPEDGWSSSAGTHMYSCRFQLTAARRRLGSRA